MVIRYFIYMLAWCCGFVVSLHYANSGNIELKDIATEIHKHGRVQGNFSQCVWTGAYKHSSSGTFQSNPSGDLIWHTLSPERQVLTIDSRGFMTQEGSDKAGRKERYSQFGGLIRTLITLRQDEIEKQFSITLTGTISEYQVVLIPKKRMARYLSQITVSGGEGVINSMDLEMRQGKRVYITMETDFVKPVETCDS